MRLDLLVLICLSAVTMTLVDAAQTYKGKAVGIIIEQSCLMSPSCLDYKDIINLDSSNQFYAGKLVYNGDDYTRKCTSKQNNHKWLEYAKNYTVMIDPCLRYQNQMQTISIVTKLDEYHLPGQQKVVEAKTVPDAKATLQVRTFAHTRYVDSTCTHAIITAKDWKTVLPDTISYLRNNCDPKFTKISTIGYDKTQLTRHDITTSYKWKLDKQYTWIKENCTKSFGACKDLRVNANK